MFLGSTKFAAYTSSCMTPSGSDPTVGDLKNWFPDDLNRKSPPWMTLCIFMSQSDGQFPVWVTFGVRVLPVNTDPGLRILWLHAIFFNIFFDLNMIFCPIDSNRLTPTNLLNSIRNCTSVSPSKRRHGSLQGRTSGSGHVVYLPIPSYMPCSCEWKPHTPPCLVWSPLPTGKHRARYIQI